MIHRKYTPKILTSEEFIVCEAKLHKIMFIVPLVYVFIMIIISTFFIVILNSYMSTIGILIFCICPIPLIRAYMKYTTTEFILTNKRIVCKTGFLICNSTEIILRTIGSISIKQNITGKIFNYGTIILHGVTSLQYFERITNPFTFKRTIEEEIHFHYNVQNKLLIQKINTLN
jgi:membrane protein YdbS with pleckstrin-like domain